MQSSIVKKDVYQMVTDIIISQLENNVVPWRKTWNIQYTGLEICNFYTKKPYRGINILLLGSLPYDQPFYLTFNQIKKLGGKVKKGEKSHIIVFWKFLYFDSNGIKTTDPATAIKKVPYLTYFNVFNSAQIQGIAFDLPKPNNMPITEVHNRCQDVITNFDNKPKINHLPNFDSPAYFPVADIIKMPLPAYFDTLSDYYRVLFHEVVHSTGHKCRLNRDGFTKLDLLDTDKYSFEELIAEIGANFLCCSTGLIQSVPDISISYIQHWLSKLRNDKKLIIHAASKAIRAVDYINNVIPEHYSSLQAA